MDLSKRTRLVRERRGLIVCPLCSLIFDDPVSLICGHVFCHSCLQTWLQSPVTTSDTPRQETNREPVLEACSDTPGGVGDVSIEAPTRARDQTSSLGDQTSAQGPSDVTSCSSHIEKRPYSIPALGQDPPSDARSVSHTYAPSMTIYQACASDPRSGADAPSTRCPSLGTDAPSNSCPSPDAPSNSCPSPDAPSISCPSPGADTPSISGERKTEAHHNVHISCPVCGSRDEEIIEDGRVVFTPHSLTQTFIWMVNSWDCSSLQACQLCHLRQERDCLCRTCFISTCLECARKHKSQNRDHRIKDMRNAWIPSDDWQKYWPMPSPDRLVCEGFVDNIEGDVHTTGDHQRQYFCFECQQFMCYICYRDWMYTWGGCSDHDRCCHIYKVGGAEHARYLFDKMEAALAVNDIFHMAFDFLPTCIQLAKINLEVLDRKAELFCERLSRAAQGRLQEEGTPEDVKKLLAQIQEVHQKESDVLREDIAWCQDQERDMSACVTMVHSSFGRDAEIAVVPMPRLIRSLKGLLRELREGDRFQRLRTVVNFKLESRRNTNESDLNGCTWSSSLADDSLASTLSNQTQKAAVLQTLSKEEVSAPIQFLRGVETSTSQKSSSCPPQASGVASAESPLDPQQQAPSSGDPMRQNTSTAQRTPNQNVASTPDTHQHPPTSDTPKPRQTSDENLAHEWNSLIKKLTVTHTEIYSFGDAGSFSVLRLLNTELPAIAIDDDGNDEDNDREYDW